MKEFEGHGWSLSSKEGELYVGILPGRLHIALYKNDGHNITPLAYFRSAEDAAWAQDFIDGLAEALVRKDKLVPDALMAGPR